MAACRTWWRSRRSYAWYAASLMIFEMSVGIDGFSRVGPTYLSIRGPVHWERPRSVPALRSSCDRFGVPTRKPLSIVLKLVQPVLHPTAWFICIIDEIERVSGP